MTARVVLPKPAVNDITDVDAPSPTDDDSLVYNDSTGKWEPKAILELNKRYAIAFG